MAEQNLLLHNFPLNLKLFFSADSLGGNLIKSIKINNPTWMPHGGLKRLQGRTQGGRAGLRPPTL